MSSDSESSSSDSNNKERSEDRLLAPQEVVVRFCAEDGAIVLSVATGTFILFPWEATNHDSGQHALVVYADKLVRQSFDH